MTCIIGYKDVKKDIVYIGADSLGASPNFKIIRNDPKFFHYTENIIFGFTSSYRMGQVIMYSKNLFSDIDITNPEYFTHKNLVLNFIPNLIKLYKDNDDDKEDKKGTFILGTFDKLWKIYSDFQIEDAKIPFNSCGSGDDFALGSLYTTKEINIPVIDKIIKGLESAECFSPTVHRPFYIINTKNNDIKIIK